MPTVASAVRRPWGQRLRNILIVVVILCLIGVLTGPQLGGAIEALTPPRLPTENSGIEPVWRGDQNWTAEQADQFHFTPQGTQTLPIPLSWFLALEQPLDSPFAIPFGNHGRLADSRYLARFGFIPAERSRFNPDGLPIGFAISPDQTIAGITQKEAAIGLTCAACHTEQRIYGGKRYVIDGGPATIDLGQLTGALRAALGQTAVSGYLPFFDGRFERFTRAVLGNEYSDLTRNQLAQELGATIKQLADQPSGIAVTEGFSRLDALNRIGNQVFALDTHRYGNYVNIDAPVKYPHIWTSPWFDWVQYDGSIMQPMVRNGGESMGVRAAVDFQAPPNAGRFASSIPFENLRWIEQQLAGKVEPLVAKAFTGLNAPGWPQSFPPIDAAKAAEGGRLYENLCSGCHLPALTPEIAHGAKPDANFWTHFEPIRWTEDGEERQTAESVLKVKIVPHARIGTDPAQSRVLTNRQVDTAGMELARAGDYSPGLGIDIDVCVLGKNGLEMTHVSDDAAEDYPLALGAVVQMVIDEWFRHERMGGADRAPFEGDRPNCLLSGLGYKARPLNGVWAVAPFLHNGSVPTLYDLLSPVAERPKAFLLGDASFDPVRVGLVTRSVDPEGRNYDENGYFILDTSKPGNRNTGHEFSDDKREGVIGRSLSPDERNAIIEFLKSI